MDYEELSRGVEHMDSSFIVAYYTSRKYQIPNVWEAMAWAHTEMAEAYEVLMAKKSEWVRNNPQNKPDWDPELFAEELGDAIMMLIVAGLTQGADPLQAMIDKLDRTLRKE